jgi:putative transposase
MRRLCTAFRESHSRPYVSDDNPYSQSHFRTLKYRPDFPDCFGCIQDSRAFCQTFFTWYNEEHRHSGIELLTPAAVHYGQASEIIRTSWYMRLHFQHVQVI